MTGPGGPARLKGAPRGAAAVPAKDDPVSTKPLVDKLGVKPGAKAVVLGVDDPAFWTQLEARTGDVTTRPRKDCDVIVLQVDALATLQRLPGLAACIKQDGAIWVAHPRGRKDLRDVEVIEAGKAAGLVDNKVCRFSDTHSALRFVIPLAKRKSRT